DRSFGIQAARNMAAVYANSAGSHHDFLNISEMIEASPKTLSEKPPQTGELAKPYRLANPRRPSLSPGSAQRTRRQQSPRLLFVVTSGARPTERPGASRSRRRASALQPAPR